MRTVLFVAPFLMEATLRFIQAANDVADTRLVVLTADGPERLPPGALHYRVEDPTNAQALIRAARDIARCNKAEFIGVWRIKFQNIPAGDVGGHGGGVRKRLDVHLL